MMNLSIAVLFSFLSFTHAFSLTLPPMQINPIAQHKFEFSIAEQINNPTTLISAFAHSNLQLPSAEMDKIAKDIILAMDIEGSEVHHMKWSFNVMKSSAMLSVYEIHASVSTTTVRVMGASILLTQPLPPVFDYRQQCARTGKRKYRIAGPRKMECNTITVPRSLNENELKLVHDTLLNRANEIMDTRMLA